jgi:8-amino-7-oxononanoate synthase
LNIIAKKVAATQQLQSPDEDALFGRVLVPTSSPMHGLIDEHEVILAGTNNYLGLTYHPQLIEAAQAALLKYGSGTTGSRMANGTFPDHIALEKDLCEFFGARSSLLFTTGYQANLAVLAGLSDRNTVLMLDADCHASIYDGATLSGATVYRFRHNDVNDLNKKLGRLGDIASNTIVVVEGIYSMLGDKAPLSDICQVAEQHNAALIIDEAHSFGVLGATGRGLAEAEGVEDKIDVLVGTFSKSAACVGGFCTSTRYDLKSLRRNMRAYVFSASMSPAIVASARAALQIIRNEPELRSQLWNNANAIYNALSQFGFKVGPQVGPVISVTLPGAEVTKQAWQCLVDNGVYVNLVLPPAAPNETCLLRCSVSAAHSPRDIELIIEAFETLSKST